MGDPGKKRYSSYVNSGGERIMTNSEGHALRPMTDNETESYREAYGLYMPYELTGEEYERGRKQSKAESEKKEKGDGCWPY